MEKDGGGGDGAGGVVCSGDFHSFQENFEEVFSLLTRTLNVSLRPEERVTVEMPLSEHKCCCCRNCGLVQTDLSSLSYYINLLSGQTLLSLPSEMKTATHVHH